MRRLGAHPQAVRSMLQTIQEAKHHIITAFGPSTSHFGSGRYPPLQGLGQGNGGAPAGWTAVSTPLINMMRTSGFGIKLLSAISTSILSFVCYAFVDDTDVVHCSSLTATAQEIITEMQEVVDHWEGGLRTTGGALRVDKSFWYLIHFIWENNEWKYATKDQQPGDLDVRGVSGNREHLSRLEPSEAKETLGVFLAMDGNNKKQIKHLRDKGTEFAEQIRSSSLNPDESWHAFKTTIQKTLEYPMEAINLTESEWDYIMQPILTATLPKSGIVRTYPRTLLYASRSFSGLGILHPYIHQQLKHIHTCMEQTITASITNNLIRSNTEQL